MIATVPVCLSERMWNAAQSNNESRVGQTNNVAMCSLVVKTKGGGGLVKEANGLNIGLGRFVFELRGTG